MRAVELVEVAEVADVVEVVAVLRAVGVVDVAEAMGALDVAVESIEFIAATLFIVSFLFPALFVSSGCQALNICDEGSVTVPFCW